jgi:glycerophosphoryl diester phosphodiesterase
MYSIIGHRGAISFAYENTISSIIAAKKINCNTIEADVLLTRDKIPIMFHDEKLDRLTNMQGNVCDYDYDEIKNVILKDSEEKIPLLVNFLNKCRELCISLMLEIKNYGIDEKVVVKQITDVVKEYTDIEIVICSYSIKILKYLNIIYPNNDYIYIVDKIPNNWYKSIQKYKCQGIFINYYDNNFADIKLCANKIPTYCFTINKIEDYETLSNTKIKGIITDKPELFI